MKQFCYVLVASNGFSCWTRVLAKGSETIGERTWDEDNLSHLVQAGWRPLRETPMLGSSTYAFSLVVLEKD